MRPSSTQVLVLVLRHCPVWTRVVPLLENPLLYNQGLVLVRVRMTVSSPEGKTLYVLRPRSLLSPHKDTAAASLS